MNWLNDLGAPVAVTAVDLVTETYAPEYNDWAAYGLVAIGYGSQFVPQMRQNEFLKNAGIAAFPWAAKKIYNKVRGGTVARRTPVQRLAMKSVGARVSTVKPEFAGQRLW